MPSVPRPTRVQAEDAADPWIAGARVEEAQVLFDAGDRLGTAISVGDFVTQHRRQAITSGAAASVTTTPFARIHGR